MFNSYRVETSIVKTMEGGSGRTVNATDELTMTVLSGFMNTDAFYEKNSAKIKRIQDLASKVPVDYAYKLAIAARNEFNLREAPVVLLAILTLAGNRIPQSVIRQVFLRGDEITEYIAAVKALSRKKVVTKEAQRVASAVLNGLTERQALRYMGGGKNWNLAQVIRVAHPQPQDAKTSALFRYILSKEAQGSHTAAWEALSVKEKLNLPFIQKSQGEDDSKVSWERARSGGASWKSVYKDMGYMALLRNLRNLLQDGEISDADISDIVAKISDRDEVLKSKQLPFRFFSAHREISKLGGSIKSRKVLRALEEALENSVSNAPTLEGKTLYIVDNSGSMTFGQVSGMSELQYADVANVLGAIGALKDSADVVVFASQAKKLDTKGAGVFDLISRIKETRVGGGTSINSVAQVVDVNAYDNVVILSDMQLADNASTLFKGFKGKVFSVNLAGYTVDFELRNRSNVVNISGWSNVIFNLMSLESKGGIKKYIEGISLN